MNASELQIGDTIKFRESNQSRSKIGQIVRLDTSTNMLGEEVTFAAVALRKNIVTVWFYESLTWKLLYSQPV
jgi:hypothetical protein